MAQEQNGTSKNVIYAIISLLIIVVVVGGIYYFVGSSKKDETKTTETEVASTNATAQVQITKDGFVPGTILVAPGTTITWTNNDSALHTVSSDPYPTNDGLAGFDSEDGLQAKGGTYSFTFSKAGTYGYHDQGNASTFKGVVIVK